MLTTRDDEFHVFVPNRLDTGFSRELCAGNCDVDCDIEGVPNVIPRPEIHDLAEDGPRKDRAQRGPYLVLSHAKVSKNSKGHIDRTLTLDFYKVDETGARSTAKANTEKYVNGRRIK